MSSSDMHLAFATDRNYVPHLAAMIESITRSNPERKFHIHIACTDWASPFEVLDSWISTKPGLQLHWVKPDIESIAGVRAGNYHVTQASYLRLLVPRILHGEAERVLYLDCDMICMDDLGGLFDIDLQGGLVAAAPEPIFQENRIGVSLQDGMFNSGMMIIDVNRFCEEDIDKQAIEFARTKKHLMRYHDQDALNHVLRGRWTKAHSRWNLQFHLDVLNRSPLQIDEREILDAYSSPAIVHFVGPLKPWIPFCRHAYKAAYSECIKATPWAHLGKDWNAFFRIVRKKIKRLSTMRAP